VAQVIRVCLAGATGWIGRALVPAICESRDLNLVGAVSRSHRGRRLGKVLGIPKTLLVISGSVEGALRERTDVLIDFTSPEVVKSNVLLAISKGVHVVIGTSGLTDADYEEIDRKARSKRVGVIAAGNFAISAVLMEHFASVAAKFMPSWEVVDYANDDKPDAPSGTTRELVHFLSEVGSPIMRIPVNKTKGAKESRGLSMGGTQVHSVRLPGYVIGTEVIFGNKGERLSIRHDAGSDAAPYIDGILLAVRKAPKLVGLRRGLWSILNQE
jgi:4-hydroxy-tetrahydrodipicolinate reductase